MNKFSNGKYDCFDDINCNDAALQNCLMFFEGYGYERWCKLCDNRYTCRDLLRKRIATQKQAELMAMRHALNPHALYFY